jgi:hypothetical protein
MGLRYRQSGSDRLEKSAAAELPAKYLLFRGQDTNLNISQVFQTFEMSTRCKLLGKQLSGAKAFAVSPDESRHSVRISHGT